MPCRLALLCCLLASALRASEPDRRAEDAESLVRQKLLAPLAARDAARTAYSRAGPPPGERRVRLLDKAPTADAQGGVFTSFAVDARYGIGEGTWRSAQITGCVYAASGEVFVKYGSSFRAAEVLQGKTTAPAASHICQAAAPRES